MLFFVHVASINDLHVGTFYNNDGSCSTSQVNGKTILGVVVSSGYIISLKDIDSGGKYAAENACTSYDAGGSDWKIPTRTQWSQIHSYIDKINQALNSLGNTVQALSSEYYWAETYNCSYPCEYQGEMITCSGPGYAYRVNPVSASKASGYRTLSAKGRCIKSI